ncbi:DUF2958 domain-containing protein [Sphingomonas sp. LR59]|uniref:DUF2958 domain-containing protein n=1 Tax=Sphingomonas sp. LR59 TaxID=3050232 RepID=UPI002FE016B2
MRLLANGHRANVSSDADPSPILKVFLADGGATWLLTEVDPGNQDIAFGLCDLGLGHPELGYVSLAQLAAIRSRLGLLVEVDATFVATELLSRYADTARAAGKVVEITASTAGDFH